MKLSKYTYLFQRNGVKYVYNSINSLFADLSDELFEVLYNRDYGQLPPELKEALVKNGILVENEEDNLFYEENKSYFYSQTYDKRSMNLVIVPTTNCNFACPYCFEGEKQAFHMSEDVEDAIIEYLKKDEQLKNIHLTWYGGEPLMAFDVIKRLFGKLTTIEGKSIASHDMVTNGYLVTDDVVAFINEIGMGSVQITLDGIREHHDRLRSLRGSKQPTFDRIVSNIRRILKECPETRLNVRVNVNRDNAEDFLEIYRMLHDLKESNRLYVYPGFIREESADGCGMCYSSLYEAAAFDFYKKLRSEGLKVNFLPKTTRDKGCMMQRLNSFIVGPRGELYKCWNDVNHDERIIGNIKGNMIENRALFYHYLNDTHAFADPECRECLLFPACSGGCGWYRSRNRQDNGRFNLCATFKDPRVLEEALLLTLDKTGIKYEGAIQMS